jgi:topoisomerase IA-like protein
MSGTGETIFPFNKGNILPSDNVASVGNTIFENRIQHGQVGGKKSKTAKKRNAKKSAKKSSKKSNKKTSKKCKKLFWFF